MPKKSKKTGGKLGGLLFGFMFFGMGSFFCWMMGISPLLKALNSNDWLETSCVIKSSVVESHNSSDGTTYSVEISFSYTIDGQNYTSDTYNFDSSSSSGRKGKAKIVAQFPKGSDQTCWVDPNDYHSAVLSRKIPFIVYIVIPFSSVFIIIGLAALLGTFGFLPEKMTKVFGNARHKPVTTEASGAQLLKPESSGIGKVVFLTIFACFWNGIISIFLVQVVKSHTSGDPEWFLTLFMIPFVCVGIFLILAIFHAVLALANPKIQLSVSESSPALGDSIELNWEADKPLHKVQEFRIRLIGEEAATYRRGTDTKTDKSIFYAETVVDLEDPRTQQRGTATLSIPLDSMHSFDSGNNKINWSLTVAGEIPRFPDIDDAYPITVRPIAQS
ncbi:MAG: DUF3592 domain-containing protein [Opitutaceae bacterium]